MILISLLPNRAQAAKVVKINPGPPFHIVIDNSASDGYQINQELCVKFQDHRGICGLLFAQKGKYAAIRFNPGFGRVTQKLNLPLEALPPETMKSAKVAVIRVSQKTLQRGVAGDNGPITQFDGDQPWEKRQKVGWPKAEEDGFHPSNHIAVGLSYLSPYMRYEVVVGRHWSLGLKTQFQYIGIPGGQISGYGGIFAASYYSIREFKGLWLHMGAGFYSLQAKVGGRTGTFSTPVLSFLAGWKWSWKNNFSFGFGFGSEFVFKTEPADFAPTFSGVLPVVLLDFGIVF